MRTVVKLPALTTSEGCADAAATVSQAVASGQLGVEEGQRLTELIVFAGEARRVQELEAGLEELRQHVREEGFGRWN